MLEGGLDWAKLLMASAARPACRCQAKRACREDTLVSGRETHFGSMQSSSAAALLSKPEHARNTAEQAVALVCAVYVCSRALWVKACVLVVPAGRRRRATLSCCVPWMVKCPATGQQPASQRRFLQLGSQDRRSRTAQCNSPGLLVRPLLASLQVVPKSCTKHTLLYQPFKERLHLWRAMWQDMHSWHKHWHAGQAV